MHRTTGLATLIFVSIVPTYAQPQVGGMTCSNATLSGPYFWLLSGSLINGNQVLPATEISRMVMDGRGTFSGSSQSVVSGIRTPHSLSGTYTVQENCTGTLAIRIDSQ